MVSIATIFSLSDNSEIELDLDKRKGHLKSDGLLHTISNFLDAKEERREKIILFNDSMQKLKAERFQDSVKLVNQANNKGGDKGQK